MTTATDPAREQTPENAPGDGPEHAAPRLLLGSPILGQINLPNALTLTGLMLALLSATFAVLGQFHAAILCMMWSGVADLFDGFLARRSVRTELESEVGKQLDSVSDVCSFGFAPAVFAFSYGLREPWYVALLLAFVCANALRLAYFNAVGTSAEGDRRYFTGLPVTYAALFIPVAFLGSLRFESDVMVPALGALYLLLALAMVSGRKVPKPGGLWYVFFSLLAVAMTGVYAWALIAGP